MGETETANFDTGLPIILRRAGREPWAPGEKQMKGLACSRDDEEESEDEQTQTIQRRVPKASLVECLNCPLCDRLCRDASTIVECLHTFCSACLRDWLQDGRSDNVCPKCSTDLGCHPFELVRTGRRTADLAFSCTWSFVTTHPRTNL